MGTAQQRLFLVLKVVLHAVVVISEVLRLSTKSRCSRCCRHISNPYCSILLALTEWLFLTAEYCTELVISRPSCSVLRAFARVVVFNNKILS